MLTVRGWGLLVSVVSLLALSCEGTTLSEGKSRLVADTGSLDFGQVFIGADRERSVTLGAPGELFVGFGVVFESTALDFSFTPVAGRLPPNTMQEIVVTFSPRAVGEVSGTIVVASDATETPEALRITLVGEGVLPPDCEDGNGCTDDTFDPRAGRCTHTAREGVCDDFDSCTTGDRCLSGICTGERATCDDEDGCTDDFCDPGVGCVHVRTVRCDDGNPCTSDFCDKDGECEHDNRPAGTPCDDGELCTRADICLLGSCVGISIPDGTECDDGEPCSLNESCDDGRCIDPEYAQIGLGDVKFETDLTDLSTDAASNPIVDRNSTLFLGVEDGVVAVDRCGEVLWRAEGLGTPNWSAAIASVSELSVPFGSTLVDLDTVTGSVARRVNIAAAFIDTIASTATTSTTAVEIVDVVARPNGALVASAIYRAEGRSPVSKIVEVDAAHRVVSELHTLEPEFARRLALDADGAVVAILTPLDFDGTEGIARFGLDGLPNMSWAVTPTVAIGTELAIDHAGRTLWSHRQHVLARDGTALLLSDTSTTVAAGSPLAGPAALTWVVAAPFRLVGTSTLGEPLYETPLTGDFAGVSAVTDSFRRTWIANRQGTVFLFSPDGAMMGEFELPMTTLQDATLTLSPDGVLLIVAPDALVGLRADSAIGAGAWPRRRRDNFSTGQR